MFKIVINNPKEFASTIIVASKIVDEIKFTADSEGLRFNQLDRSHICFIGLDVKHSYFTEYVCDEPETFTVDTIELVKVLKRAKNDDLLTITVEDESLVLVFEGDVKRTFRVRLISSEMDNPTMPSINYPVTNSVLFKDFTDSVNDCALFGDKLYIKALGDKFFIRGDGEFGDYNGELLTTDLNLDSDEFYESVFNLPKVKDFFGLNISKDLTINLGNDIPLMLEQNDEFGLSIKYLIAPRIEQDEGY